MKQRIYAVSIGDTHRLVRASHPNVALMHVVRAMAQVRVADQDTLVELLAQGVLVEQPRPASDDTAQSQLPALFGEEQAAPPAAAPPPSKRAAARPARAASPPAM